jgi:hypothetical protein
VIWQRLRYGTLVAAGVAVTGATIYLGARRTTAAVDLIELTEGLEERYRAVSAQSPSTFLVSTQQVDAWGINTNGWTYEDPGSGTNAPTTNTFLVWTGTVSLVTTTAYTALTYSMDQRTQVGRTVWTGWTNLTASGFVAFSAGNGLWQFAGTVQGVDYYRNTATSNRALLDHGPGSVGWEIRSAFRTYRPDPANWILFGRQGWTRGNGASFAAPWYDSGGAAIAGTVAAAGDPAYYGDRPAYVTESQRVPITRTAPPQALVTAFDAALLNLVTQYVDSVDSASGAVRYHSVTGLFARLSIGNRTNQFTRQPALGTNAATYGAVPLQMAAVHYTERYALLHALTQTVAATTWWTNSMGTNAYSSVPSNAPTISEVYSFAITNPAAHNPGFPVVDGGSNVPAWWVYCNDDTAFSGPFWTGPYWTNDYSQLYNGLPAGDVSTTATEGVESPIVDYRVHYYHRRQQDYTVFEDFADPAVTNYTLTLAGSQSGGTDTAAYTSRISRLALPLYADLTGVTVQAHYWAAPLARTNVLSPTWYPTGAYYQAAAISGAYTSTGQVFRSDHITLPFSFAPTNLPSEHWRKDGPSFTSNSPPTWREWTFAAIVDNSYEYPYMAPTYYYGAALTNGPVIVTWGFTRCTN